MFIPKGCVISTLHNFTKFHDFVKLFFDQFDVAQKLCRQAFLANSFAASRGMTASRITTPRFRSGH
jgi:hypothetical protein